MLNDQNGRRKICREAGHEALQGGHTASRCADCYDGELAQMTIPLPVRTAPGP
jgi:hypothetical protein